jgi:hypothetical protein
MPCKRACYSLTGIQHAILAKQKITCLLFKIIMCSNFLYETLTETTSLNKNVYISIIILKLDQFSNVITIRDQTFSGLNQFNLLETNFYNYIPTNH